MFRALAKRDLGYLDGFRLRGRDVTRLEGFSDAVFGFALTLLVVSLDVPRSYHDLINTMRGFPAFATCFWLLIIIWNSHYKFSRRFGLDDLTTRTLTCILLFVVLFFVYPLKFLFTFSFSGIIPIVGPGASPTPMTAAQASTLLIIYGLGFAAVYFALIALYLHAWRMREVLELNELEKLHTRHQIYRLLLLAGVGLLAAALACNLRTLRYSGFCYLLLFPILRLHTVVQKRSSRTLTAPAG
ncbi:MAG: DUF1211 domain-containing protein [Chthoniobacterales bacterium]|nr:DUF1211 domain-containing protein [Chthoniobacterales bacterium]